MELRDRTISKKWVSRYTGICYMYGDMSIVYVFSVYIIIMYSDNYYIYRCDVEEKKRMMEERMMRRVVDVGFEEFEEMKEICEWWREVRDEKEDGIRGYVEMVEMRMSDEVLWCVRRKDGWRVSMMVKW